MSKSGKEQPKHPMKVFLVTVLMGLGLSFVGADFCHAQSRYVKDNVGVLSPQDVAYLSSISEHLDRFAKIQLVQVIVETTNGRSIEREANQTFEKLGIGYKGSDKGVLIYTAVKDKKIRIEVGYGLEEVLTDGVTGEVLDRFVLPYFKEQDLGKGLFYGQLALAKKLSEAYDIPLEIAALKSAKQENLPTISEGVSALVMVVIILVLLSTRFGI